MKILHNKKWLRTSRESTCGEEADISEPVSLVAVVLNSACSDVPVLLTWGTDASPFTASPTGGDRPGLWLAVGADVPPLSGAPFVCGLSALLWGLMDTSGLGGKLKVHDCEFGAKITPLGGLTMRDDGPLVGEWMTCVVAYRGLIWMCGDVWFAATCGDVMFWTRSEWRENGALNCDSLRSPPLALLLRSRGPSNVPLAAALFGDESREIELFVSSVLVDSPFGVEFVVLSLCAWSTLKCLNGLLRSSGGMSGFFFRLPGPLNNGRKKKTKQNKHLDTALKKKLLEISKELSRASSLRLDILSEVSRVNIEWTNTQNRWWLGQARNNHRENSSKKQSSIAVWKADIEKTQKECFHPGSSKLKGSLFFQHTKSSFTETWLISNDLCLTVEVNIPCTLRY